MEATAQQTYNQLGRPRYYHGYGSHVDMRGVRMAMGSYAPSLHVLAEVGEALGFIEARVEDDGELLDVLLVKSGFERFEREWTKLNPSREEAQDADYIIERTQARRAEQAAKQEAARQRIEQPRPWNKHTINHSGSTSKIDVAKGEGVENNMVCGVVDGVAVPYDPSESKDYSCLVAATGPHPWGFYLSGPVLLIPAEGGDGLSVGMKVYPDGPRSVSSKGDTAIGRVVGSRDVNKRGPCWKVQFNFEG